MSIALELNRLQTDRNTIRTKLVDLGLSTEVDNLDALATAIEGIANQGAVSATVQEGDTYTIPKGYHNGSGTVSGIKGGGNYTLQSKKITPTKKQQNVTPDSGYYGLSDVTVAAIPNNFQDVSSVNAAAADVLTGKIYVTSTGVVTTGTMPNNGAVDRTLSATAISYTIPKGFHDGTGTIKIVLEEKAVVPTKEEQVITPTSGKVLSKVTVSPIPADYITTTDATATANQILADETAYVAGKKVTGIMPNNGAANKTLNTKDTSFTIPEGYHNGLGKVNIVTETKTVTPSKSSQTVNPGQGKVLSSVTVNAIPGTYQDVTGVTVAGNEVLEGKKFVSSTGELVTGTMPNNGAVSKTIDGLTTMSASIPAGYTTGGTVTLTGDIEEQLSAI